MLRNNPKATIREDEEYLDAEVAPRTPENSVVTAGVVLSSPSTTFGREHHPDNNQVIESQFASKEFDDDFHKKRNFSFDWFFWTMLGMTIVLFTLVGYGFGSGLYLPNKGTVGVDAIDNPNDATSLSTSDGSLFKGETPSDTLIKPETNRQDYKYSIMTLLGLPIVMEGDSAQAQAIDWLAFDDEPLFDPNAMVIQEDQVKERLTQRYALVVWYFDQGGPAMWTTLNREESAGWIANGAGVHECNWRGIDCDYASVSDGRVIGLRLSPIGGLLLTGSSVSSELGLLTGLQRIDFSDQRLQGKIPNSWALLTNLETVILSKNKLQSTIPEWIGGWTNLQHLALDGNQISGTIPSSIASLQKLEQLELQQNSKLRGPFEVLFSHNNMTSGPKMSLQHLDLSSTDLEGELPRTTLPSLKFLRMWDVKGFIGTIPPEIGSWSNLEYLSLMENQNIVGSIPTELGLLENLETFELVQHFFMSGTLPTELGNLNLKILNVRHTNQTGSLPVEWSNMDSLVYLDISNNNLDGTIPSQYSRLSQLEFFFFQYNKLTGEVPGGVCSLESRKEFIFDCADKEVENGKISCLCCLCI